MSSVEDAITAVALNGEIQAAIIRHDLPLRSHERLPLMTHAAGHQETCRWPPTAPTTGSSAASGSGSCDRTSISICSPTNRSPRPPTTGPDIYDRTFYRLNDVTDLHSTVLAGMRNRFATPFFDALRAYASAPVGQFHALPVARGASIFNSKSLQDMGEFYGRNIFMAETSIDLGWAGFAAGPARQHQEGDGQGRQAPGIRIRRTSSPTERRRRTRSSCSR